MDAVKQFFVDLPIPVWLKALIASMIPLLESRYAILFFMNGDIPFGWLFLISVIGNMIPVPVIMLLFRPIIEMLKKTKLLSKFAHSLEGSTNKKAKKVLKYKYFGLLIFVAIPAPGTGAISGACVASILNLRISRALPLIFLGTVIATAITTGGWSILTEIFI